MRILLITFISVLIFSMASPKTALADWEAYFIQITCLPDLEYFSVKSFALGSVKELPIEKATSSGIYSLQQLVKKPVDCQLKYRKISVEMIAHHEPQSSGSCGGMESASFAVKFDGIEIGKIASGGGCEGQNYKAEISLAPSRQYNCVTWFKKTWDEGIATEAILSEDCKPISIPDWDENTDSYKRKKLRREQMQQKQKDKKNL